MRGAPSPDFGSPATVGVRARGAMRTHTTRRIARIAITIAMILYFLHSGYLHTPVILPRSRAELGQQPIGQSRAMEYAREMPASLLIRVVPAPILLSYCGPLRNRNVGIFLV